MLPVDKYSGSSMGNLPIGQGIAVTPMQMAQAYAAIANGGILRQPQIVRRIDGERVDAPKGRRSSRRRPPSSCATMLEGAFAPGGTASEVSIPGYKLAGKTGTANKIDPKTGEYSQVGVRRVVHRLRARAPPAAADRRDGRRAARRDLRRHGRGARVRADRVVRAAVPADPAGVRRDPPARAVD